MHDAFEPGKIEQFTSENESTMAGALTNSLFTDTAPPLEPNENTTIPKRRATEKPLEVAVTVISHVPPVWPVGLRTTTMQVARP